MLDGLRHLPCVTTTLLVCGALGPGRSAESSQTELDVAPLAG
jgi:hypothetical protein